MIPQRAASVTKEGEPDGWTPEPGYHGELDPRGQTRLVVSVPPDQLPTVHRALIASLSPRLGLLYRQKVDRRNPRPQTAPPVDHVGLDLDPGLVHQALEAHAPLVYGDARAEIWIRGRLGEQVVLDIDGVIFCYPDDPAFRDALDAIGVPDRSVQHLGERDYVKHWYHAACDAHEDGLRTDLGLQQVAHR